MKKEFNGIRCNSRRLGIGCEKLKTLEQSYQALLLKPDDLGERRRDFAGNTEGKKRGRYA